MQHKIIMINFQAVDIGYIVLEKCFGITQEVYSVGLITGLWHYKSLGMNLGFNFRFGFQDRDTLMLA